MPPQYNPKEVEGKVYRAWEESGFFNPDNLESKKTFTIVVPPPNVTGSLHMGHALNATIQDILIRKKRMEGYKTLWLPGTDHAGIATQNVVEKELKKEGLSRHDLGREKFLERIWQWKEKYGNIILDQFKKLGASMDWSRTRFTMDPDYQEAVKTAFLRYYEKGWIYRAERVINWCRRCATSLSDLELEYKEVEGQLYYIKYPLASGGDSITVATTRPETMLGDTAVAVNPKDKRYAGFVGKEVVLPIQKRKIPIIADREIDAEFGTGAVKVTPAHDLLDAEIGERHKLPRIKVIDANGLMTKDAGKICAGLKVAECREKVIEELRRENFLEREETYKHNVAVCYRCGTTIEPIPSLQWFLKMEELAKSALKAAKSGKIKFYPSKWEKVYSERLKNERDWNISRQLWWGHQLPVFYCGKKPEKFQIPNSLPAQAGKFQIQEEYFIISEEKPKKCPFCGNCEMKQADDVLDTWFSSALWPFATLGWPKKTKDLEEFYPTRVLSTARDIISIWVAKMVFSGLEFMKNEPFKDVIIHATILTKEGKRMSKSLGTGIDPMILIEKYGADATRFGLIWQAMGGQDIHWAEEHVIAGKKFANKIWNAARFYLNQESWVAEHPEVAGSGEKDKKILASLKKAIKAADAAIESYEFGQALHKIYDFFWHEFCDVYIEQSKKEYDRETFKKVLTDSLKILHPFMPFITEEIWSHLEPENKKLLLIEKWPASA